MSTHSEEWHIKIKNGPELKASIKHDDVGMEIDPVVLASKFPGTGEVKNYFVVALREESDFTWDFNWPAAFEAITWDERTAFDEAYRHHDVTQCRWADSQPEMQCEDFTGREEVDAETGDDLYEYTVSNLVWADDAHERVKSIKTMLVRSLESSDAYVERVYGGQWVKKEQRYEFVIDKIKRITGHTPLDWRISGEDHSMRYDVHQKLPSWAWGWLINLGSQAPEPWRMQPGSPVELRPVQTTGVWYITAEMRKAIETSVANGDKLEDAIKHWTGEDKEVALACLNGTPLYSTSLITFSPKGELEGEPEPISNLIPADFVYVNSEDADVLYKLEPLYDTYTTSDREGGNVTQQKLPLEKVEWETYTPYSLPVV